MIYTIASKYGTLHMSVHILTSGDLFRCYAVLKAGAKWDLPSVLPLSPVIHQYEMRMIVIKACALGQHTGSHVIGHHALR